MVKRMKTVFVVFICILFNFKNLFAANGGNSGLEEISKGILGQIYCVETIDGKDAFYVGTQDGLYTFGDAKPRPSGRGRKHRLSVNSRQAPVFRPGYTGIDETIDTTNGWEKIKLPQDISEVKRVAICNGNMFIAASGGVFVTNKDMSSCRRLLSNTNIKGVAASLSLTGGENVLAWSETELFQIKKDAIESLSSIVVNEKINDAACRNGTIYVASSGNIYYSSDGGKIWSKILLLKIQNKEINENTENDAEEKEEEAQDFLIKNIDPCGPDELAIATSNDVFIIKEKNYSIERINTTGLPRSELSYVAYAGETLFAATRKRIFMYLDKEKTWKIFSEVSLPGDISFIKGQKDKNGKYWLWIGAGRYLYRQSLDFSSSVELNNISVKNFPLVKESEVSIRDVQKMAIEYAEVSPEKIKKWRTGAQWKAIMPKISLDFSESLNDNTSIYTSSTTFYSVVGPRKKGNDWGIDLSWDLSDLIWNEAQTSIDVRSKLMVQLRDDILEEVTRLYFERKRLLMEIDGLEAKGTENQDELLNKRLKVEELTAYIDAFTGGKFSDALKK